MALAVLCNLSLFAALGAQAHEMRPAFLQINELDEQQFEVVWKQPVLDDRRLPLEPVLPQDCKVLEAQPPQRTADALLNSWHTQCDLRSGTLRIEGLTKTLTDVMVRIRFADGSVVQHILRPDSPSVDLATDTPYLASYLVIGMEHLLFGFDHILFVIGLVLYINGFWPLIKTITSFTLAHSITLALAVTGLANIPQAPVEAIIALSIVFLARELLLPESARSSLTSQRPWLMAFGFGLLHGFGFAGALADIGLPQDQLAPALLLFNLGLELGQLLVVFAVLAITWGISKLLGSGAKQMGSTAATTLFTAGRQIGFINWPLAMLMGGTAAYWTIDRVLGILL